METRSVFPVFSTWIDFPIQAQSRKGYSRLLFNLLFLRILARLLFSRDMGQSFELSPEDSYLLSSSYPKKESLSSMATRVSRDYHQLFKEVARKYRLPLNLLQGVVKVESNFDPQVVSPCGALGLMQLMPETARALGVKNPFDPRENLEAGARYLRQMLDLFRGNIDLALAAYNAGPGSVQRYGGIPPYKETQEYIEKIKAAAQEFEAWA